MKQKNKKQKTKNKKTKTLCDIIYIHHIQKYREKKKAKKKAEKKGVKTKYILIHCIICKL